ncbi:unnamed protein product [Lactuca saligna]|uniref:Uncharacterized protein n=1 Tax=Lactuca saligna TaxID=75948 RepID=A0AA36EJV7_LACSI|nr:unnamed protein product [Lactuca saligna]
MIVEYPLLSEASSFKFDYMMFLTNSFCAFALNLAVFLLVGKTSALTMNVAGVVKDWLLIAFSWHLRLGNRRRSLITLRQQSCWRRFEEIIKVHFEFDQEALQGNMCIVRAGTLILADRMVSVHF